MKFTKQILENGLRVITIPMPDNPAVTVLVMVEAGSKYETKEVSGISHFLEHMVFKGTPRRPKAIDISRELDGIGAHYNAFTSHEFTGYYAKAEVKHLDTILDIVSDMYLYPLFDEKEMAKEKGVIIEELRMYKDLPQRHVHNLFTELLHGDQPAGWNIIGTEESIQSFSRDALVSYRTGHYVSGATTIVVSGSFDEARAVRRIGAAFSAMSAGAKTSKLPVTSSQDSPQIRVENRETDQTHLVIGVRTFSVTDKRIPAMRVLSSVLGGGMSSRLFSKMRDELGICYYVRAEHEAFTDHGDLNIAAGVDNKRLEEAVTGILEECQRLVDEPVPPEELKKAKDHIAGSTMLELETSDARAEFCGIQEIMKRAIELPEEIVRNISAVTAEDVQALAREIFVNEGLNLAVVGRTKNGEVKEYFKFK